MKNPFAKPSANMRLSLAQAANLGLFGGPEFAVDEVRAAVARRRADVLEREPHELAVGYVVQAKDWSHMPMFPANGGPGRPTFAGDEVLTVAGMTFRRGEAPRFVPAETLTLEQQRGLLVEDDRAWPMIEVLEVVPAGFADGKPWRIDLDEKGGLPRDPFAGRLRDESAIAADDLPPAPAPAPRAKSPTGIVLSVESAELLEVPPGEIERDVLERELEHYYTNQSPRKPHPLAHGYLAALRNFDSLPTQLPRHASCGPVRPAAAGMPVDIDGIRIKDETPKRFRVDELTYRQRAELLRSMDILVVTEIVPPGFGGGASWRREEEV